MLTIPLIHLQCNTCNETLLDLHKSTLSASSKDKDGKFEGIWDRDCDMSLGGRLMDEKTRNKMVKDARSLGDRFSFMSGHKHWSWGSWQYDTMTVIHCILLCIWYCIFRICMGFFELHIRTVGYRNTDLAIVPVNHCGHVCWVCR